MDSKYNLTIPKPCHEDWNTMTPDETGRFCGSCIKSVVDFTNMKAPEIQDYFSKNQGQSICGRFHKEQINRFDIQIPQSVLTQRMPFRKAFLLALFIAMGTTLFSCKNHNDATLGEVTVVDTIHNQDETVTGDTAAVPIDTVKEIHTMGKPMAPKEKLNITIPPPKIDSKVIYPKTKNTSNTLVGFTVTKLVVDTTQTEKK